MGKGGGGPSQTTSDVRQTTSNLPEYAEPYYRDLLARTGYETSTEYQPYEGQRLAYFSPMEQEAMARIGQLGVSGTPEELNQAGRLALQAGQGFDHGITTGGISSSYQAAGPSGVNYDPTSRGSGYSADQRGVDYQAGQRGMDYQSQQLGDDAFFEAGSRDVGFEPGTLSDSDMISQYSDPYMQQVVDVQKREAMRDADIQHQRLGLDSVRAGGPRGNYRLGILEAETERDLGQRLDDIQLEGASRAFGDAKQSFEADRSAKAQLEDFQQQQFGLNQQMSQRQAELMQQGFSYNEAARQAQEQFGQAQFGLNEQSRQAQEQFGQSQFGMNEQARQQQEAFQQSQFGMNSQNQQFGAGLEMQKYQAYEQAKQQAASLGLQANQIEQAGQIAAANIMLGQQQNSLNASSMLGQFADQRQGMEMDRLNAMMGVGAMDRGLMQQGLDIGYQDYLRQQAFPREQLAFYSQMLQGTPIAPGQTTTTYGQQPSYGQQMMGMGLGGLGLYNAFQGGGG